MEPIPEEGKAFPAAVTSTPREFKPAIVGSIGTTAPVAMTERPVPPAKPMSQLRPAPYRVRSASESFSFTIFYYYQSFMCAPVLESQRHDNETLFYAFWRQMFKNKVSHSPDPSFLCCRYYSLNYLHIHFAESVRSDTDSFKSVDIHLPDDKTYSRYDDAVARMDDGPDVVVDGAKSRASSTHTVRDTSIFLVNLYIVALPGS